MSGIFFFGVGLIDMIGVTFSTLVSFRVNFLSFRVNFVPFRGNFGEFPLPPPRNWPLLVMHFFFPRPDSGSPRPCVS